MEKNEKLKRMLDYALVNGLCKNKTSFASLIGIATPNLSRALQGQKSYITDSMLLRANKAIGNKFNPSWLLYDEGDMFSNNTISDSDVSVSVGENNVNGSNNSVGVPPKNFEHEEKWFSTMNDMLQELRAQREESARQIDRLLSIIEKQQNK